MSEIRDPGNVFVADCPARLAIDLLGDKWSLVTISALRHGPRRHGELARMIGGISRKMLTQTLNRLKRHGLVGRRVYAESPPRVEYELSELGRTLVEPIAVLTRWAEEHGPDVVVASEGARPPR